MIKRLSSVFYKSFLVWRDNVLVDPAMSLKKLMKSVTSLYFINVIQIHSDDAYTLLFHTPFINILFHNPKIILVL